MQVKNWHVAHRNHPLILNFLPIFGIQPRIIIVTDKKINPPDSRYRVITTDMRDIEKIL